jgi:hypothetical protein
MPCSCLIPGPAYPENKEWGPFVWSILHALAERTTRIITPLYEKDERRAWIGLIQATGPMLPCSDCRDHYATWLSAHPVTVIMTLPTGELLNWVRRWFYDLHENVNQRLGKPGIPFENLTSLYGGKNISMDFKLFEMIEKRAIQQQGVNLKAWLEWVKQYRTLASVYGIS